MRVLLVSSGYPPRGQWGTEHYTRELARGLARRGHEVEVLLPKPDGGAPYEVETVELDGLLLHLMHVPARRGRDLRWSYADPGLEASFARLVRARTPDVVHFLYLLWRMSARLPLACRELGVPCAATLTDLGLFCHRGQMVDWRLRPCGGPHPARTCARCIRSASPYDGAPARVLAKRWGARALALVGGAGLVVGEGDVRAREQAVRACLEALGHVIAPTRALERLVLDAGVPRERVTRLVYAFDERPFLAARGEPAGERVTIGYLGQFAPHKGPHTLLEAVRIMERRLPESVEPWQVLLYGEGGAGRHRRYPRALFAGGIGPRLLVCPPFGSFDLPQVLAALHAVVVPSQWMENAPLAALEARAAGVPVFGSDVPGVREVIEPGVHGRLFPPGDARALADLLREVVLRRVPRSSRPGLPLSLQQHLQRVEAVHTRVAERAPSGAGA